MRSSYQKFGLRKLSNKLKLYEFREYAINPVYFGDYMSLTSGGGYDARLEASKCIGFWTVETGGDLSRAIHIWEYDSLAHRSQVRSQLAGRNSFVF